MGNKQTMEKWYASALSACFAPTDKVSDATFLKIFAAVMCIPCNSNYNTPGSHRKAGAAALGNQRTARMVEADQLELLEKYRQTVESWEPASDTVKLRMEDLADLLINRHLSQDSGYAKKNSNYKPANYLGFFLAAPQSVARARLEQVAVLYGQVLRKIYQGLPGQGQQLQRLQRCLQSLTPDDELEPLPGSDELGWHMCALLLLGARTSKLTADQLGQLCALLGMAAPESHATLSVLTLENVPLKMDRFQLLCAAALRAELELGELQGIFQTLSWIYRKVDEQLDSQTRALVEQFIEAVKAFGDRKSAALQHDWLGGQKEAAELAQARELVIECQKWLT